MRRAVIALAIGLLAAPRCGFAQDSNVIAVPPAPPITAAPLSPSQPDQPAPLPPPGLVQIPAPPINAGNADTGVSTDNSAANPPPTANAPNGQTASQAPPANTWVPETTAEIGVLDKVDGGIQLVSIPVGSQSTVGALQVSVLACVVRPPDEIPDAAVFLSVQSTDNPSGPPLYRGWLVRSTPGAVVVGDASETFRIARCS